MSTLSGEEKDRLGTEEVSQREDDLENSDSPQDKEESSAEEDGQEPEDSIAQEAEESEEELEEVDEEARLQEELTEMKDKYLRLYSEFENYRRRTAKEKLEFMQTANVELISKLLPVVDDFERALTSLNDEGADDIKALKEGVDLVAQKLQSALNQVGLEEMDTSEGSDFDPELHDAISQMPAPKKKLKGKVIDTVEKGYFIGDKVVRHAKVVIGN